jgi:hypothetical protein
MRWTRVSLAHHSEMSRGCTGQSLAIDYVMAILPTLCTTHPMGGGTSGVHLVLSKNLGRPIATPAVSLRLVVKHFIYAAACGGFQEITPPVPLPSSLAHTPIVVNNLRCVEGLYDVFHPEREYALPCLFKPFVWVRRRLAPKEWLGIEHLERDHIARRTIALAVSPLVINHFCSVLWGVVEGEEGCEATGDISLSLLEQRVSAVANVLCPSNKPQRDRQEPPAHTNRLGVGGTRNKDHHNQVVGTAEEQGGTRLKTNRGGNRSSSNMIWQRQSMRITLWCPHTCGT